MTHLDSFSDVYTYTHRTLTMNEEIKTKSILNAGKKRTFYNKDTYLVMIKNIHNLRFTNYIESTIFNKYKYLKISMFTY